MFDKLISKGIRASLDERSESMNYKIREAFQDKKVPYAIVIGDKEIQDNKLSIRKRSVGPFGETDIDSFIDSLEEEIYSRKN